MAIFYAPDLAENPANPPGFAAPSNRVNGRLRFAAHGAIQVVANFNEIGDIILLQALPSSAVIINCMIGWTGEGTSGVADFGFCDRNGANVAPSGTDSRERLINDASVATTSALLERRFTTFAEKTIHQPLWQLMGYTSDPAREWFLCVRCVAVGSGPSGQFPHRMRWVED